MKRMVLSITEIFCNTISDMALDELPYIAETDESFLSRFQVAVDTIFAYISDHMRLCNQLYGERNLGRAILNKNSPKDRS